MNDSMSDLPALRPSLIARVRGAIERALGIGIPLYAGSSGLPAQPGYPVEAAEIAFDSNPWVYACIQAISTDLSGVPLVAETGTGLQRQQSYDHWLLRLLERPGPKLGGRKFRKQIVADLAGYRNAYVRVWRDTTGRPIQLDRCHPRYTRAILTADGEPVGWEVGDKRLSWQDVLHIGDITLSSDESFIYGESPVRSLALGLQVDRDSRRQAGRAAKRGRLEMMVTPRSPEAVLGKQQVQSITDGYRQSVEGGHGLYVVGMGMDAHPLNQNARDSEFINLLDRSRAEVLAAFSVPETRVGAPAANYGTSKQQMRTYWETLQGLASLIDDELSRLADDGTRIRHSFAQVEALQTSRTEQQARASIWVQNFGLAPAVAARYEGFADLPPATMAPSGAAATPPSQMSDPPPDEAHVPRSAIVSVLMAGAGLYDGGDHDVATVTLEVMLRRTLVSHGVDPQLARDVAGEAASVCAESALALDSTGEVYEARAFGAEHAARIVRLAGIAA